MEALEFKDILYYTQDILYYTQDILYYTRLHFLKVFIFIFLNV